MPSAFQCVITSILLMSLAACGGDTDVRDNDGDGLMNAEEAVEGTDPNNEDTDGDTILDHIDNCPLTANTDQEFATDTKYLVGQLSESFG